MHRIAILLLALTFISHVVAADPLYKWVDEQGNVHYSDKPQPGAKKLKLPQPSTYTAPVPGDVPAYPVTDQAAGAGGQNGHGAYTRFEITSPPANGTVWNTTSVTVSVTVEPGLQPGDKVTITLDGKVVETEGLSATFDDLERGEHSVSANLRAADGTAMVAQPITFYIQRATQKGLKP